MKGNTGNKMETQRRPLNYNVGAIVIFVISIGLAVVVYAARMIPFDLFNPPTWVLGPFGVLTFIFGPLGVYTLTYSFVAGKEWTYYLVWGTIMFAVAVASALYSIVNIFVVAGILLIILAVIGLVAYWRGRK